MSAMWKQTIGLELLDAKRLGRRRRRECLPLEPHVVIVVALSALGHKVLRDGFRVDAASNVGDSDSRFDLGMLASHVSAQLGCSAAISVVGSGDAPLLNNEVGFGGAVLESFENVGGDV